MLSIIVIYCNYTDEECEEYRRVRDCWLISYEKTSHIRYIYTPTTHIIMCRHIYPYTRCVIYIILYIFFANHLSRQGCGRDVGENIYFICPSFDPCSLSILPQHALAVLADRCLIQLHSKPRCGIHRGNMSIAVVTGAAASGHVSRCLYWRYSYNSKIRHSCVIEWMMRPVCTFVLYNESMFKSPAAHQAVTKYYKNIHGRDLW